MKNMRKDSFMEYALKVATSAKEAQEILVGDFVRDCVRICR